MKILSGPKTLSTHCKETPVGKRHSEEKHDYITQWQDIQVAQMCKSLTHFYEKRAICATDALRHNESVCLCCNKHGVRGANFMCLLRNAIMLPPRNVKSHFKRETGMNHARLVVAREEAEGSNCVQKLGFYPRQAQTERVQPASKHKVKRLVALREGNPTRCVRCDAMCESPQTTFLVGGGFSVNGSDWSDLIGLSDFCNASGNQCEE